jgi:hypothetical protein
MKTEFGLHLGGAAGGHGNGADGALAHEFEDVRLGESAVGRFASEANLLGRFGLGFALPVANSSMARRTLAVMRKALSIGSVGGPALSAASARGAGFRRLSGPNRTPSRSALALTDEKATFRRWKPLSDLPRLRKWPSALCSARMTCRRQKDGPPGIEARWPCTTAWCDQISTPAKNQLRFLFGTHLCP